MKLYSWNVNGIRAVHQKGIFLNWLVQSQADVLGIQETKASPDQLSAQLLQPEGYHTFWASSTTRKGYSGVGIFSKQAPKQVLTLGLPEFDQEGRTLIAEFDDFYFVTAYFPNGGRDHERVPYKMAYKAEFLKKINALRQNGKPVIFCGDINTSHQPIDLARPKQNEKTTGFMPMEREWLDQVFHQEGYVDTFRYLYPDKVQYSWWSNIGGARAKNVGWRLDYVVVSPELKDRIQDAEIHTDVMGSDHCPVSLTLK